MKIVKCDNLLMLKNKGVQGPKEGLGPIGCQGGQDASVSPFIRGLAMLVRTIYDSVGFVVGE